MNRWSSKFYVPDLVEKKMSIDRCVICKALIDTDAYPESYREEADDDCVCDACWQERDAPESTPEDVAAAKGDIENDLRKLYPKGE
jgi:hypothetical protein